MTRVPLIASTLVLLALAAGASSAAARPRARLTCHSGRAVFHRGRIRIFRTTSARRGHGANRIWFVCSARLRKPRRFLDDSGGRIDQLLPFRPFGRRVAFGYERISEEASTAMGWVDVDSGAERDTLVAEAGGGFGEPPFGRITGVAVAPSGAMAMIETPEGESGQAIGWAPYRRGHLGLTRPLTTVAAGDALASSLAIGGGSVSWTTTSGAQGSFPLP